MVTAEKAYNFRLLLRPYYQMDLDNDLIDSIYDSSKKENIESYNFNLSEGTISVQLKESDQKLINEITEKISQIIREYANSISEKVISKVQDKEEFKEFLNSTLLFDNYTFGNKINFSL